MSTFITVRKLKVGHSRFKDQILKLLYGGYWTLKTIADTSLCTGTLKLLLKAPWKIRPLLFDVSLLLVRSDFFCYPTVLYAVLCLFSRSSSFMHWKLNFEEIIGEEKKDNLKSTKFKGKRKKFSSHD